MKAQSLLSNTQNFRHLCKDLFAFVRSKGILLSLTILLMLPPLVSADSISVNQAGNQLQIALGTSNGNSVVPETTNTPNEIFVVGTGYNGSSFSSINSLEFTFQGSNQIIDLNDNNLSFSASLTSPIVLNGGGSASDQVVDNTASGGNIFDFSGFSGTNASLRNYGTNAATIIASKSNNITLTDTGVAFDTIDIALSGVGTANLTHTSGSHVINTSAWTGNLTLRNNAGASLTVENALNFSQVTNNGILVLNYNAPTVTIASMSGTGSLAVQNATALTINQTTITGVHGASPGFGTGGNGGDGISFNATSSLTTEAGTTITGGRGGTSQAGGSGGNGVTFHSTGSLNNTAGASITGGHGGDGTAGNGGNGGNGVYFQTDGELTNQTGSSITAGNGGYGNGGNGGNGGAGAYFNAAGTMVNQSGATISGGNGGYGYDGGADGNAGAGVYFGGGAGNLTNAGTINGGVSMGNYTNTVRLVSGGLINGNLNINTNTSSSLILDGSGNQAFSSAVNGTTSFTGSLSKQGSGTWTLDTTLGYSGSTTLQSGNLQVSNIAVFGTGAVQFTGGTLLYGSGITQDFSSKFSNAASQLYSINTNENNVTFGTALTSAGGSLTKLGSGTLTLSATNTYSGGTILKGGFLQIATLTNVGNGSISFEGGSLQYAAGATQDFSSIFSTAAGQLYSVDTNGNDVVFATGLNSSGGSLTKLGSGTLTLTGASSFSGNTSISNGNLEIGTLGSGGSLAGSSVTISDGGLLSIVNGSITGGASGAAVILGNSGTLTTSANGTISGSNGNFGVSLSGTSGMLTNEGTIHGGVSVTGGSGNVTNSGTINSGVSMGNYANTVRLLSGGVINGNLNINTNTSSSLILDGSGNQNFSSAINGTTTFHGSLIKQGTGQWTMDVAMNYLGGTMINGGILRTTSQTNIQNGAIQFGGGTLQYGVDPSQDFSSLFTSAAGQHYSIDTNGYNITYNAPLTSSGGTLSKLGTGTLVLTGANTFGGSTVTTGTLQIGTVSTSASVIGAAAPDPYTSGGNAVTVASGASLGLVKGSITGGAGGNGGVSVNGGNAGSGVFLSSGANFTASNGTSISGGVGGNGGWVAMGAMAVLVLS